MSGVLLVLLVVLIIFSLPHWPYATNWGYYPSGLITIVLIVLIVLVLTGRLG